MKIPAFQFYPADWRKDPGVQSLTYHDRGVWFEILCLMHESSDRGKLLLNGQPMPTKALARLLGVDISVLTNTLDTLLSFGVCSKEPDTGVLYNRRMVKDEAIRKIRSQVGKMGGNPKLVSNLVKQNDNIITTKDLTKIHVDVNKEEDEEEKEKISRMRAHEIQEAHLLICSVFGITEQHHYQSFAATGHLVICLQTQGQIQHFNKQIRDYIAYKSLLKEKKHSLDSFIGKPELSYQDGKWNSEDWSLKLSEAKRNGQPLENESTTKVYRYNGAQKQHS